MKTVIRTVLAIVLLGAAIAGTLEAIDRLSIVEEIFEPDAPSLSQVERRDLLEINTWDGILGYVNSRELVHRSSAGVLSWVGEAGSIVEQGDHLYRVDDLPVVLLYGEQPLWRSLDDSSDGEDVEALEAALVILGYDPDETVTVDSDYTANTAAMVERFQEAMGQEVTGEIELGTVLMSNGPLRIGEQLLIVGSELSEGTAINLISAISREVSFEIDPETRGAIEAGMGVTIRLPDRSTVDAIVVSISPGIDADSGAYTALASLNSSNGYESDQLEVAVLGEFVLFEDALTVAPNALVALEGSRYELKIVGEDGIQSIEVDVLGKSGRFVAISAAGLTDGTIVLIP